MYAAPVRSTALGPPPGPSQVELRFGKDHFAPTSTDDSAPRLAVNDPAKHTQYPYVTGTSVIGLKYKDGVMVAADMLGAYGSTLRYKSVQRVHKVNSTTLLGASGEISDYHYILKLLDELSTEDFCYDDGAELSPKEIYAYLTRVMYNRRNKFNPLWNNLIIAGFQDGEGFVGNVNMIGAHYSDDHLATGFGNHLARPILRAEHDPNMTEEAARKLLEKCLMVLYYRDKNSINKFQLGKVTADGVSISEPFAVKTEWNLQAFQNPSRHVPGTW